MIRLFIISSLLLTPAQLVARTWDIRVDSSGDAPTVQAGIDSAASGDTVLVHPGTYNENIESSGQAVVIRSSAGPGGMVHPKWRFVEMAIGSQSVPGHAVLRLTRYE